MKESSKYIKIVEWSEEDNCFVGSSPGLFLGGCHGDDELEVFEELQQIVDETIEIYLKEGRTLPLPISGKDVANILQEVA